MDAFLDRVSARDEAWQPHAGEAAASVQVTVNGRPVALDADGSFHIRLPCGAQVDAGDGAGGTTALRARCG